MVINTPYLGDFARIKESTASRSLNDNEEISLKHGNEEMVSLELYEIVCLIIFAVMLLLNYDIVMTSIIRNDLSKVESRLISDDNFSTALCQASLVAFGKILDCRSMRFDNHAGHINNIELATILNAKDRQRVCLQNICNALIETQFSRFRPFCLALSFLVLK